MEQKHVLLSALSVGVGLGVGLGLSSGQRVSKWVGSNRSVDEISAGQIEQELLKQMRDGKDSEVTFDEFPYYLSERIQVLLTSAAYVHLNHTEFSKHTRNLSPASRAILLSGASELYLQMLAKALAHYFKSKLLLLDVSDFSLKMQSKYGCAQKESSLKRSISEMTLERMSSLFGSFSILPSKRETTGTLHQQSNATDMKLREIEGSSNPSKHQRNSSALSDISSISSRCAITNPAPLKHMSNWCFDEKLFLESLYKSM